MDNNKFQIRKLAKWREESAEMFKALGLRQAQYEPLLGELADLGTEKIIAKASQFLFDFKESGPEAMKDRHGVSRATAYNRRSFALEIVSKSITG
jgi:hypothetical protein